MRDESSRISGEGVELGWGAAEKNWA